VRACVHACMCACMSVLLHASIVSKWLNVSSSFMAQRLPSAYATMCFKEIQVSPKLRELPSGTFLQTLDFKNFATAHS